MTTIAATAPATGNKLVEWIARNGPVLAIFALIFALWEAAVQALGVPEYILPSPSVIVAKMVDSCPLLLSNAMVSLEVTVLGYALSLRVAIPLAVAGVYSAILTG